MTTPTTGPCVFVHDGGTCGVEAPIRPDHGPAAICDHHDRVLDLMGDALAVWFEQEAARNRAAHEDSHGNV